MEENTPLNDKDKTEEKEYVFNEHQHGSKPPRIIRVKESELTKPQKDLLLGEVIKRFNDLPSELQEKFLNKVFNVIKDNRDEKKADIFDEAVALIQKELNGDSSPE